MTKAVEGLVAFIEGLKCPSCVAGKRVIFAAGSRWEIKCETCDGTGKDPAARAALEAFAADTRPAAAPGEAGPVVAQQCLFDVAWIGRCKEQAIKGGMCGKHADKTCEGCGVAATRSCDHTGQFVCGSPICGTCQHGEVPRDSLFGMGGGHGPCGGTARTGGEAK